ncbi:FAD-dependent oxidoreductase [Aminipila sp.]|uniref:FAD-dependent oxidoreductase n=1 Tax=Aminipila sp. TaxID=2060095 RepID=UPI002F42AABC
MYRVVVIGGGWSGCAAAVAARKAGASVVLIEKTDLLLGLGNVGGIMRNNGRFTAAEENIALGASELFQITDSCSRHRNVDFPGHKHASLYDVMKVEPQVRRLLKDIGIEIHIMTRVIDVVTEMAELPEEKPKKYIKSLIVTNGTGLGQKNMEVQTIEGDVFIECTGSTGPYSLRQ